MSIADSTNKTIEKLIEESYTSYRVTNNRKLYTFDDEGLHRLIKNIVHICVGECWYDATAIQIARNIKNKFGIKNEL